MGSCSSTVKVAAPPPKEKEAEQPESAAPEARAEETPIYTFPDSTKEDTKDGKEDGPSVVRPAEPTVAFAEPTDTSGESNTELDVVADTTKVTETITKDVELPIGALGLVFETGSTKIVHVRDTSGIRDQVVEGDTVVSFKRPGGDKVDCTSMSGPELVEALVADNDQTGRFISVLATADRIGFISKPPIGVATEDDVGAELTEVMAV